MILIERPYPWIPTTRLGAFFATITFFMEDPRFMRRCLDLARQGRGRVGNGALVGAVLVRRGKVIAEAFHEGFGCPHAERKLLETYPDAILPNDVLYVNLEPCCHTGKTPPCTNILIERGVKHVIYGMCDPDIRVSGQGIQKLDLHGIHTEISYLRAECELLNKGFALLRSNNRPWITLKMAKDSQGSICNADGTPKAITSKEQNIWSHTFLRLEHDAIAVGIGTILSDDPKLDTRFAQNYCFTSGLISKNYSNNYQQYRLVFDPDFRIPLTAGILSDEKREKTIVCVSKNAAKSEARKIDELRSRGVKVFEIETESSGFVWESLWSALITPTKDFFGITSILLEGGARTWNIFQQAGMVDEEVILRGFA